MCLSGNALNMQLAYPATLNAVEEQKPFAISHVIHC
jgi:hypothetical protein